MRNYVTRYWLATIFCLMLILMIAIILLVDRTPGEADNAEIIPVIVEPGDTLWSIARRYYPDKHTGQMVEVIRQLNPDLDTGRLQVGQVVWLPGEVMQ